jgi:hypothetical protein
MIHRIAARAMFSVWAKVPLGAADPILGVASSFKVDKDPKKVNLSIGAYRDNEGKPVVLPSVKQVPHQAINDRLNKSSWTRTTTTSTCPLRVYRLSLRLPTSSRSAPNSTAPTRTVSQDARRLAALEQ